MDAIDPNQTQGLQSDSAANKNHGKDLQAEELEAEHHNDDTGMSAYAYDPADGLADDFDIDRNSADEAQFVIEEDRFTVEKAVWNDFKYAVAFLIFAAAFILVATVLIGKHLGEYVKEIPASTAIPNAIFFELKTVIMALFVTMMTIGILMLTFILGSRNTTRFTQIGFKFIMVASVVCTVGSIGVGQLINGFLLGILSAILVTIFVKYKPLITLAANILDIVIKVLKKYPVTVITALFGSFINMLFVGVLSLSTACAYISYGFHGDGTPKLDSDGNSISHASGGLIFLILFLNFGGLYIVDVLRNVIHVTIGGIYGTWYYTESTFTGMPKKEGVGSFKRAMSYNLGSICFGSFFVVLFQTLAVLLYVGGRSLGGFGLFINLVLKISGTGVGYFNLYAYSFIALYGVSIFKSVRATYKFFRQRGLQAVLNDFIINASLGFYYIVALILTVTMTALYLFLLSMVFTMQPNAIVALIAYSSIIAIAISQIFLLTIVSGSSVFFFALNKDPSVFEESHPFEFQEISRCYPKVLTQLKL